MRTKQCLMIAAALAVAACTPEKAAGNVGEDAKADDFAALGVAALAGWDAGAAAAPGATLNDDARCAVYWEQWVQPIADGRTPAALIAAMPEQVREVPGGLTYRKLSERLMARFDRDGVSPGDGLQATERWKPEAAATVDRAIEGNRAEMQGLMQILATCSKG